MYLSRRSCIRYIFFKMSTSNSDSRKRPKLTKGDKCILIHITVTFLILLILVIIYVVHIIVVKHQGYEAFRITRRSLEQTSHYAIHNLRYEVPDHSSIGMVFIATSPPKLVCNSILLKPQWSLAPAHCVTMRAEPELSQLLPKWRIRYKEKDMQYKESDIKRGIVHSYYNRDDLDNNIGLFENMERIHLPDFKFPIKLVSDILNDNAKDLVIVGWDNLDEISSNQVFPLNSERCSQFVIPIVDVYRKSELCVVRNQDEHNEGVHGAALFHDSEIVGFFSWGDRTGAVPQVVLTIAPYKIWLENIMAIGV